MTSDLAVADNPLAELPVGGGLVAQLDKLLIDLGFTAQWAAAVEFLILAVVAFLLLSVAIGKVVPWMSGKLNGYEGRLTAPIPAVLLAPEWMVTTLLVKAGRKPGAIVYGYGEAVLALTDWLQAALSVVLRFLGSVGKFSRQIAIAVLVLGFLSWNSSSCVADSQPCISPVQHWMG
ncbi:hypothetical protein BOX37_08230 [Nocardia mangyaensis]|uniref:Uncharacterized protein n=1 Tax=Nocardia mangyaensis TaxID=2213200 RepID=A0A1J0VPJ3_9NOCA|nr:hypothetical protein [Nocardia mangyaensis]APE33960.1 hypothetical protein BOX37_08230 [Nocardia mangyaensis]